MRVRANKLMLDLLGGIPEADEHNSHLVPQVLTDELRQGFREVDGCVVPGSFEAQSIWTGTRPRGNNVDDETGLECFLSKVYINGVVERGMPPAELVKIGCAYAMSLRKALLESPVYGHLRVIVDAQEPDPDLSVEPACSVRFYRVRPDQSWLAEDLESYKINALWVLDFEKSQPND